MYGSIEAGGTKFVCAVCDKEMNILERVSFPTTDPEETMGLVIDFFNNYRDHLEAIGIGSFGPIDIRKDSDTYGYITNTPKLPWRHFDFVGTVKREFDIPIAWTTDVNAAAYGEAYLGAGKGLTSVAYYTVGTGFGGGVLQEGHFIQGYSHPEMGHLMVRRHPEDSYQGHCPNHKDCLEGMACGPAIEDRLNNKPKEVPANHPYWAIEAYYIAQSAYTTCLFHSPEIMIYGGGVMKKEGLIDKVRIEFEKLMNKYVDYPEIEKFIVAPGLGDDSATYGCLLMAKDELKASS